MRIPWCPARRLDLTAASSNTAIMDFTLYSMYRFYAFVTKRSGGHLPPALHLQRFKEGLPHSKVTPQPTYRSRPPEKEFCRYFSCRGFSHPHTRGTCSTYYLSSAWTVLMLSQNRDFGSIQIPKDRGDADTIYQKWSFEAMKQNLILRKATEHRQILRECLPKKILQHKSSQTFLHSRLHNAIWQSQNLEFNKRSLFSPWGPGNPSTLLPYLEHMYLQVLDFFLNII